MSAENFEKFRQAVVQDRDLHQRLCEITEPVAFAQSAVSLGKELGYHFSETDVAAAIREARMVWLQRLVR